MVTKQFFTFVVFWDSKTFYLPTAIRAGSISGIAKLKARPILFLDLQLPGLKNVISIARKIPTSRQHLHLPQKNLDMYLTSVS
jgi:hypothetical protein